MDKIRDFAREFVLIPTEEYAKIQKERQFFSAMTSEKSLAYEANLTTDEVNINDRYFFPHPACKITSYSKMIDYLENNCVHESFIERFESFTNPANLRQAYLNGWGQGSLQYRFKVFDSSYKYLLHSFVVICDHKTGNMIVRGYIEDITEEKEKEELFLKEQLFYDAMLSNALDVYEVNITRDMLFCGQENWEKHFHMEKTDCYSEFVEKFATNNVFTRDVEFFRSYYSIERIKSDFLKGKREVNFEYRRLICGKHPQKKSDTNYRWVATKMRLYSDPDTDDICGFAYVLDVNDEKVKRLDLIFKAEHDQLTRVYNKVTFERQVSDFLASDEGKKANHAFFIMDMDCFKIINDEFGHLFGDILLAKTAESFNKMIGEENIVGRIGGDEFGAFIKNASDNQAILNKAQDICKNLKEEYSHNSKTHMLTTSIGISYFPKDGLTYKALFENADIALYDAKKKGKNRYAQYQEGMAF